MGRIFFVLCVLGLGWWFNTNGVLYNLMNGLEPEPARKCMLHGARKDGVYFSPDKENISYQLDTQIGTPGQKLEAAQRLAAAMSQDLVSKLPEGTGAKVVSSSTHKMYGVPHHIVQIQLTDPDFAGQSGWVERDNVIDSPFMEAYNSMRATGVKKSNSKAANP